MDLIAGGIEALAILLVGEKNRWGWMIGILCCILWIAYVLINKVTYGILIPTILTLLIDIWYFRKWKNKRTLEEIEEFNYVSFSQYSPYNVMLDGEYSKEDLECIVSNMRGK